MERGCWRKDNMKVKDTRQTGKVCVQEKSEAEVLKSSLLGLNLDLQFGFPEHEIQHGSCPWLSKAYSDIEAQPIFVEGMDMTVSIAGC